jgi:hypothetical protein
MLASGRRVFLKKVVVENPILNSPYEKPTWCRRFFDQGVTVINVHGGFGRWAFVEIADPWDAKDIITKSV